MLAEVIKEIFDKLQIANSDINLGFFAGVGLALLMILILMVIKFILMIVFRNKKCSGINIVEADGETYVSKTAISSLIMHLEKQFPLISITKIVLFKCRRNHSLKLYINFNDDGSGLLPHKDKLKSEIRSLLKHTFGINSIKKIIMDVRNATLDNRQPDETASPLVTFKPKKMPVATANDDEIIKPAAE